MAGEERRESERGKVLETGGCDKTKKRFVVITGGWREGRERKEGGRGRRDGGREVS